MPLRPLIRLIKSPKPSLSTSTPTSLTLPRRFSILPTTPRSHTNRIFDPIRQPNDLHTLTMLNAADNRTLITLWSAKWCTTCQAVAPLLRRMLEDEKVGEREGGLGYVEVEMDSTLIGDLPVIYRVSSMPTLLAFSRQEAQFDTKMTRPDEMRNEGILREWGFEDWKREGVKTCYVYTYHESRPFDLVKPSLISCFPSRYVWHALIAGSSSITTLSVCPKPHTFSPLSCSPQNFSGSFGGENF